MCRFIFTEEEKKAIDLEYEYRMKGLEVPEEIKKIVEEADRRYEEACG